MSITISASAKPVSIQTNRATIRLLCALLLLITAIALRIFWGNSSVERALQPAAEPSPQVVITQLRQRLQRNPDDTAAYAQLGLAMLARVRTTSDPLLYLQAEKAFDEALKRDPAQIDALAGQGILALARHNFADALIWAEQARALNPFRAQLVGIQVDAYVELGRYPEAVEAAQQMVDLRPGLHSYSRVSYIRELHGDAKGAIDAMQAAVDSGIPGSESRLWSQVQLGTLYLNQGDIDKAETVYRSALKMQPTYLYALAGLANIEAAHKKYPEAIELYEQLVTRLPLPAFVGSLGELYEISGNTTKAQQQYDLVDTIERLNIDAGMNVDLELAFFNARHGNPRKALAQARAAYATRPTLYAADTLAWALYKNGKYTAAWRYSQEAMRLGTKDARLQYHAGMIAQALGNHELAKRHLSDALSINPYFSILDAPVAQKMLDGLSNTQ